MSNRPKTIKVGDLVRWESQANGSRTKKQGTVVEVVAPNAHPTTKLAKRYDPSASRGHESYVVEVVSSPRSPHNKVKTTMYWPVASRLKLAGTGKDGDFAVPPTSAERAALASEEPSVAPQSVDAEADAERAA